MKPLVLSLLVASSALAEAQRPRVAVHPLVLEGVDSRKDREELTALLPGIVISVGKVEIASPSDVDAELKKKGQAFCSTENLFRCLSYIADHTSSVHALRIELRRGGRVNEWELLANVVRVDGEVERQPDVFKFTQPDNAKLVPIARAQLEQFVASLKLGTLPLAPPAQPKVEPPPPNAARPDAPTREELRLTQPPPPPPPENTPPMRVASYVLTAATVVSLAASAGLAISATADRSSLHVSNGAIPYGELGIAKGIDSKSSAATAFLVVGALAASTAVTFYLLSRDSDDPRLPTISPAPFPGGAGVVISSGF